MTDTLIVTGANCTWWDDISKTANSEPDRSGIPLCPHCKSPLFQMKPETWDKAVAEYEAEKPGYKTQVDWMRGKCFPNFAACQKAYENRENKNDPS